MPPKGIPRWSRKKGKQAEHPESKPDGKLTAKASHKPSSLPSKDARIPPIMSDETHHVGLDFGTCRGAYRLTSEREMKATFTAHGRCLGARYAAGMLEPISNSI